MPAKEYLEFAHPDVPLTRRPDSDAEPASGASHVPPKGQIHATGIAPTCLGE